MPMAQIQLNIEDSGSNVLKIFLKNTVPKSTVNIFIKKYCTCGTVKKIFWKNTVPTVLFFGTVRF
jgi:hypothetical protein